MGRCARFLPFALATACSTAAGEVPQTTAAAITSGSLDPGDPAVVALVDASDEVACSGTLVSPHVVLTAAHCGIGPTTFTQYSAYLGGGPASQGPFVALSTAIVHPAFDPGTLANDLALVVLATDVSATPIPMLSASDDATFAGATLRIVGFGATADAGAGTKHSGTASVTAVAATTVTLAPDPSQPCGGDSGGPGLLTVGGVEVLAAATSHGDAACDAEATDTRVDAYVASFIQPYLESLAEGSAQPGARCYYPEQCAGAACVVAADDPSLAYCAPACTTSVACPTQTQCTPGDGGSLCLYPLPTPGAIGSSCASASDCVGGECTPGGVCSVRCVSGGDTCPAGFACDATGGIDFYCLAAPTTAPAPSHSSCAATGNEGAPARSYPVVAATLFLAGAAARRRRGAR